MAKTDTSSTLEALRRCLSASLPQWPAAVDVHLDLFQAGVIDSLSLMEAIVAIEKTFTTEFEPEDLTVGNLSTLSRMAATVERRVRARSGGRDGSA